MSFTTYEYGTPAYFRVVVETGMPQEAVQIGTGRTWREAFSDLSPTPIQSTGRDGGVATALRWAKHAGWIDDLEGLEEVDVDLDEETSTTAKHHHATKKSAPKKTWHIFETARATGDRWVAGPYMTKRRAEELAGRYMTDPPGRDSLRRSGVYIVKDHGP